MSTAPETPIPLNEHEATRERVLAVAGWLMEGKLRPECVAAAISQWSVSRRTAQVYVARAAARIVRATTFADPLFALKLSQVQRDKLHQELQELLRQGDFIPVPQWQMKVKTIQADMKLLDSRDRTALKLLALEAQQAKTDPRPQPAKATRAEKTLRRDQPAAKTNPQPTSAPTPQATQPSVDFVKRARAALFDDPAQPTAQIAIVPEANRNLLNELRPAQGSRTMPAPFQNSCALATGLVDNAGPDESGENVARQDPRGSRACPVA